MYMKNKSAIMFSSIFHSLLAVLEMAPTPIKPIPFVGVKIQGSSQFLVTYYRWAVTPESKTGLLYQKKHLFELSNQVYNDLQRSEVETMLMLHKCSIYQPLS